MYSSLPTKVFFVYGAAVTQMQKWTALSFSTLLTFHLRYSLTLVALETLKYPVDTINTLSRCMES